MVKDRQLIGGCVFPPEVLDVLFQAFDDAWAEVAPDVEQQPGAIETARTTLAGIVIYIAKVAPVDRHGIKTAAVEAFRQMHRIVAYHSVA